MRDDDDDEGRANMTENKYGRHKHLAKGSCLFVPNVPPQQLQQKKTLSKTIDTYVGVEDTEHVLDECTDFIRLPFLLIVDVLEMSDHIHDVFQPFLEFLFGRF